MNITNSSLSNSTGAYSHSNGGHDSNWLPVFMVIVGGIGTVAFTILAILPIVVYRKPKIYKSAVHIQFLNQEDEEVPRSMDELDPNARQVLIDEISRENHSVWEREDVMNEKREYHRDLSKVNFIGLSLSLITCIAGTVLKIKK